MSLQLNVAVYQAEVKQRNAEALARQKEAEAYTAAKLKEETAWANNWKAENIAAIAAMLKRGDIDKATHDLYVKETNAQHAAYIKEFTAAQAEQNKWAKDTYTQETQQNAAYLKDMQAEIAAEQKRLKAQYDQQTKLAAEAKKNALAELSYEKALYTAADYQKKVADINNDYARITDAINTAYTTIQQAPAERRETYLSGGIGSLAHAQELLAKSKETAAANAPIPTGAAAKPLTLDTSTPTAVSGPAPPPVATPSQLPGSGVAQGGISEEEQARARAAVTGGLTTPFSAPSVPATPQAPTGPQQPPVTATPSPYGDIFSKEQQFPSLLQGAANPYLPTQQPLVPNLTPQQPRPPMPNMQFQPMQPTNILQGLQQPTGQTLPAQSALPFSPTTPVNPYIDAYQGMLQTARPPEEQTLVPQPTTPQPTQTTGMF